MSIVRIERYARFTNVPNEAIEDDRLSFRARGILVYLLSKPDTWDARSEQLIEAGREGREAIRAAMRELKEFGYLEHTKEQYVATNGKKLWRTVVIVRDLPSEAFRGTGFRSSEIRPSEIRPSENRALTANTEQQTLSSKERKKTSSPSSSRPRSARPAPDDGPDKSKVDDVHAWLRPETKPQPVEKPRRASRKKTATEEHIHAPQRRSASGLACYWAILLENTGSLEPNEEARVGKFFKVWLERGLEVDLARKMIDLFFADLELANSTRRWTRFVAHAESLRQRVLARDAKGGRRSKADSKPFSWIDSLPPALREVALSGEDVA